MVKHSFPPAGLVVTSMSSSPSSHPHHDLFDQSALTQTAQRLVEAARKSGADAADVVAVRSVSQSVEVREGKVEESERSESDDIGLRVIVGRKQALVSTNDLAADHLDALVTRAIAMAKAAPDDPYVGLADPDQLARDIPDLDLVDHVMPSTADLEARARAAEDAGRAVAGVTKSGGASASCGIGGMVLATSNGFCGAYLGSRHGVSMTAIAGEGTGMERDYDHSSALFAADLEDASHIGRNAGLRAVARLNPRKVATCKVPVVFAPRIAGSIVSHLASAVNGAAIARKTSFLRDAMGQKIFAGGIDIIDDPKRPRGLRSRPFDGEGVACSELALVKDGILSSWVLDCVTARELGLTTTGHAARGVSSPPSPSVSNLYMTPGALSPEALIADIKQGFYVTDLIGMGANIVTGDYSRGAAGFWIENGVIVYPVSEVTIAGHLSDIFKQVTPANDLAFRYGVNAPTLRIESLTVAGR